MEDLIGFYELAIKYCDKKSNRKNDKNYIYDETLEMREWTGFFNIFAKNTTLQRKELRLCLFHTQLSSSLYLEGFLKIVLVLNCHTV